jgi:hypothetical protein
MRRAVPRVIAWAISEATAFSTHPPDTDPRMAPDGVASMTAPGARGALPQTWATTARPIGSLRAMSRW